MLRTKTNVQQINTVNHEGKVILFAIDGDGKIAYTVRQDGFESDVNSDGWSLWQPVPLPVDSVGDPSVTQREAEILTGDNNRPIIRSIYDSVNITAVAAIQAISAFGYIYLFRQSKEAKLLVDRFVLNGETNRLNPKLDVRFKRSRMKYQPAEYQAKSMVDVDSDSLDFRDVNGNEFYEPSIELSYIEKLYNGWFSVVLTPTAIIDRYVWHIFVYNAELSTIELVSIRASKEGWFDVADSELLPGITRRTFKFTGFNVNGKFDATRYDVQRESQTQGGPGGTPVVTLLKDTTRLMLVAPTDSGIVAPTDLGMAAALNFSITGDGMLSQIDTSPDLNVLKTGNVSDVLLPLNTLDSIFVLGEQKQAYGTINAIGLSDDGQIKVAYSSEYGNLEIGKIVELKDSQSIDGVHTVSSVQDGMFDIAESQDVLARWRVLPEENTPRFREGAIVGVEKIANVLRIHSSGHGLEAGGSAQVQDSPTYDGIYTVIGLENGYAILDTQLPLGYVLNTQTLNDNRRGIVLNGNGDYLELPKLALDIPDPARSFSQTIALWVSPQKLGPSECVIVGREDGSIRLVSELGGLQLKVTLEGGKSVLAADQKGLLTNAWTHYAAVIAYDAGQKLTTVSLYRNGELARTAQAPFAPKAPDMPTLYVGRGSSLTPNKAQPQYNYFAGSLSELQIWNCARSAQDIRNSMYMNLLGREEGLAGYWLLGAINEGSKRTVVDSSTNGCNGIVYGNAYVSERKLNRMMSGGMKARYFETEEYFAVTQGAVYTETFDFRTENGEVPAFKFRYWGKRNQISDTLIDLLETSITPIDTRSAQDGWSTASCRFKVPEGIALMRTFGIDFGSEATGAWQSMQIRRHRIQLSGNGISVAHYVDELGVLQKIGDLAATQGLVDWFTAWEAEEGRNLIEKARLERDIAILSSKGASGTVTQLNSEINNLDAAIKAYDARIFSEQRSQLNSWCSFGIPLMDLFLAHARLEIGAPLILLPVNFVRETVYANAQFMFEPVNMSDFDPVLDGSAPRIPSYYIRPRGAPNYYLQDRGPIYGTEGAGVFLTSNPTSATNYQDHFFALKHDDGTWEIQNKNSGKVFTVDSRAIASSSPIVLRSNLNNDHQRFKATYNDHEPSNSVLIYMSGKRAALVLQMTQKKDQLTSLRLGLESLKAALSGVVAALATAQTNLQVLRAQLLPSSGSQANGIDMKVAVGGASNGLVTTGGLLGFLRPSGPLSVIETCEGNVQVSYLDNRRRMRFQNFDATADTTNTTFEQWIVDTFPACVNLGITLQANQPGPVLTLIPKVPIDLGEQWTIETWFRYPLPATAPDAQFHVLTDGQNGSHVVVKKPTDNAPGTLLLGSLIKIDNVENFYGCGYSLDSLDFGWHHLTAVGDGVGQSATTRFYIDGAFKGDLKSTAVAANQNANNLKLKVAGSIERIGNSLDAETSTPRLVGQEGKPHTVMVPGPNQCFGALAEIRFWNVVLSDEEIAMNSQITLVGREPGLLAYFRMNEGSGIEARDATGNGYTLTCPQNAWWVCAAPIGQMRDGKKHPYQISSPDFATVLKDPAVDGKNFANRSISAKMFAPPLPGTALVSCEYVRYGVDNNGTASAMMQRFLAYSHEQGVEVLGGKRVEELERVWIGNAQFKPTLLGFIEGAPPIPSENLTVRDDYNGATSVELALNESSDLRWSRSDEKTDSWQMAGYLGAYFFVKASVEAEGSAGVTLEGGEDRTSSQGYEISTETSTLFSDRIELRGTPEPEVKFAHLGRRFIPKNVGYALVISGTADVFILRLKRSKTMVSYDIRPQEGIPLDVNTITYMMNPAYIMNGSLDGLTGSSATSSRYHRHVPDMRLQFGSRYPASYFRVEEAYRIKQDIDQRDKDRESFFSSFKISSSRSRFDEVSDMKVGASQEESGELQGQADTKLNALQQLTGSVHAKTAQNQWKTQTQAIMEQAGKRNIVNTYVWDSDGGLRVESQSFANSIDFVIAGAYSSNFSVGARGEGKIGYSLLDVVGGGAQFELSGAQRWGLNLSMSKTESQSRGFTLNIDLGGVEYTGITDYNDRPILPGEKVSRYRFMSFYLEPEARHQDDFFSTVVDPEWLESNSEEARALRQVRDSGGSNKAWRVMHRVTYVERPALMNFGRDIRAFSTVPQPSDTEVLASRISALEKSNQGITMLLRELLMRYSMTTEVLNSSDTVSKVDEPS